MRGHEQHDRQHDRAPRSTAWIAPDAIFCIADRPDRHRRDDAVLDLARVAELLHERQRDRLDALEDEREADERRATSSVENWSSDAPLPPTP